MKKYGYLVNVNGPVYLSHKQLESIYVKFNIIKGHFDCGINKLLSKFRRLSKYCKWIF